MKSVGNCEFGHIYAFTEEILSGKLHSLCSVVYHTYQW